VTVAEWDAAARRELERLTVRGIRVFDLPSKPADSGKEGLS
jgi:hypothetical protein